MKSLGNIFCQYNHPRVKTKSSEWPLYIKRATAEPAKITLTDRQLIKGSI